jgi:glycerol-3-phosphate dehydrogenase
MELATTATIIGAGATGLAVGLELLNFGISFIVVEKGQPGMGATCNSAGVLHSGARYALIDPHLAELCSQAKEQLEAIVPFSITNKNDAYYLITDSESEGYARDLLKSCKDLDIPIRHVTTDEIRHHEPRLKRDLIGALAVPDYIMDPFPLISSYTEHLSKKGALLLRDMQLREARRVGDDWKLTFLTKSSNLRIAIICKVIVVASGAWTPDVLKLFGVDLTVQHINGSMLVFPERLVNRIVCLCNAPSSYDSVIPCYESTLVGSTWKRQDAPEPTPPSSQDYEEALDSLSRIISVPKQRSFTSGYSGVRTMLVEHNEPSQPHTRTIKRNFHLLDHERLHGVKDLLSVFGGKLTLHNLMAFEAAKLVCGRLGLRLGIRTAGKEIEPPRCRADKHLADPR